MRGALIWRLGRGRRGRRSGRGGGGGRQSVDDERARGGQCLCPAGEPAGAAAAFLTEGFQQVAFRCLTASPASFPPLIREVSLPASLPATAVPGFFRVVLPPGVPPGDYLVFLALTAPEAFADGVADAGDVIAVATAGFTVRP
jgi:hypothetical protein